MIQRRSQSRISSADCFCAYLLWYLDGRHLKERLACATCMKSVALWQDSNNAIEVLLSVLITCIDVENDRENRDALVTPLLSNGGKLDEYVAVAGVSIEAIYLSLKGAAMVLFRRVPLHLSASPEGSD